MKPSKEFLTHYTIAALWSTCDEAGEPMDKNFNVLDIAPETLAKMAADCEKFQTENSEDLSCREVKFGAHDFWLTRCGHGAGFWDGDWPEATGERLTKAAKAFGNVDLYVGDDKRIYF